MLVRMLWKRKKKPVNLFYPTVFHFHFDYVQKKKKVETDNIWFQFTMVIFISHSTFHIL